MGKRKAEQAHADWPQEKVFEKQGRVHITGRYKDPGLSDRSYYIGASFWALTAVLAWFLVPGSGGDFWFDFIMIGFFGGGMAFWVVYALAYLFQRKNLDLVIGPESIKIDGRHYDLKAVSEFRAERHRKAVETWEKHGTQSKQYGQALEVLMQYGERVVPIAEFRGRDQDKARALVIKLQNWCDGFKSLRKKEEGVPGTKGAPAGGGEFGPAPPIR